jgi:hypothetical protein
MAANTVEQDVEEKITFDKKFDKLNRGEFAERLTKAITTFSPFYEEAYVLSLNATFGSGKTTFLEMWKNDLIDNKGFTVVHINAWETDFDDEPIIPIASALLQHIEKHKQKNDSFAEKSLQALVGIAELGNYVLQKTVDIDVKELDETELEKQGKEISKAFGVKQKIYSDLRKFLPQYAQSLKNGLLIIMIDELDRVRPDYAVKFLEAVKHIFSAKGVCFVLAIDRQQLEVSVKQLYGNEIDFDNYFLRFITREVDLPEACTENLLPFIQQVAEDFFDKKTESGGISFIFADSTQRDDVLKYASAICTGLKLRPRQIEAVFRQYSQFIAIDDNQQKYNNSWLMAPFFLIALKVAGRIDIYEKIEKGQYDPLQCRDFIRNLYFPAPLDSLAHLDNTLYLLWHTLPFLLSRNNTSYIEFAQSAIQSLDSNIPKGDITATLQREITNFNDQHQSKFQDFQKKLADWSGFLG